MSFSDLLLLPRVCLGFDMGPVCPCQRNSSSSEFSSMFNPFFTFFTSLLRIVDSHGRVLLAKQKRWFHLVLFAHALHDCSVSSRQKRCKNYAVDPDALPLKPFETLSALSFPALSSSTVKAYQGRCAYYSNTIPLRHAPRCPDHHDTREATNKKGIPPTSVDLMML